MKISSYDPQGKLIEVINSDDFVPEYIKSYDNYNSVLYLYKLIVNKFKYHDAFCDSLKSIAAETLFNIDYDNYIRTPFSQLKKIEIDSEEAFLNTPMFEDCELLLMR